MSRSDFEAIRHRYLPEVEKTLDQYLGKEKANQIRLCSEMTAYHLETGGKRLRALIPLYVYQAFDHDPMNAVALGAAIEMIHNATLVHDDLQDGDELRRDRPTVWKKYSEAQAINCGDAMFQYAFRLLAQLKVDAPKLVKLMDRAAAATLAVIEGQAQEFLMKDEPSPNVDRYIEVIRGKTSGLFALPVGGAMEALGLDANICSAAEKASMDLGMLFQVQDDLLDVYGKKGRDRVATDVAEGKISILVAHVYEKGSSVDKAGLTEILRKPRAETSDRDIQRAISLFEKYDAKGAAVGLIRRIQKNVSEDAALASCPEIRNVLLTLGETFLEPVNGIL